MTVLLAVARSQSFGNNYLCFFLHIMVSVWSGLCHRSRAEAGAVHRARIRGRFRRSARDSEPRFARVADWGASGPQRNDGVGHRHPTSVDPARTSRCGSSAPRHQGPEPAVSGIQCRSSYLPTGSWLCWLLRRLRLLDRESHLSHRRFEPADGRGGSGAERTITGRPGARGNLELAGAERSEFSALWRKW